jgi:cell division transport system ATP-binding protein
MENQPLIELKDAFVYKGKSLLLNGVSLNVNRGEFIFLIGKTGSGKSSLLKTLYGDLQIAHGFGRVDDFDLQKIKPAQVPFLRRKLGIVFQDFQLLTDRSVKDNLEFVLKATGWKVQKEMDARIDEVLTKVGLQTKGYRMPHELSGGEQQRVVIARALLNEPALILADEPTGNLDPDTSDEIMRLMIKLNNELNTAVLMATHNYLLLEKYPARTIKVQQGNLIEDSQISI